MTRGRTNLLITAALVGCFAAACSEPTGGDVFGSAGGGGGAGGEGGGSLSTSSRSTSVGTSNTSTSSTSVATSTSTGPGCEPFAEYTCFDGSCVDLFYACDGFLDCVDGSDEAPANPQCASSSSTSTGGPTGWTCEPSFYGAADGCDCGCGILDPDCPSAGSAVCEYCTLGGSCALFSCDEIAVGENWRCIQ